MCNMCKTRGKWYGRFLIQDQLGLAASFVSVRLSRKGGNASNDVLTHSKGAGSMKHAKLWYWFTKHLQMVGNDAVLLKGRSVKR